MVALRHLQAVEAGRRQQVEVEVEVLLLMLRAEVGAEDLMEAAVVVAEEHLTVEAAEVCSCLLA